MMRSNTCIGIRVLLVLRHAVVLFREVLVIHVDNKLRALAPQEVY
jgi:hypothetical protein